MVSITSSNMGFFSNTGIPSNKQPRTILLMLTSILYDNFDNSSARELVILKLICLSADGIVIDGYFPECYSVRLFDFWVVSVVAYSSG